MNPSMRAARKLTAHVSNLPAPHPELSGDDCGDTQPATLTTHVAAAAGQIQEAQGKVARMLSRLAGMDECGAELMPPDAALPCLLHVATDNTEQLARLLRSLDQLDGLI